MPTSQGFPAVTSPTSQGQGTFLLQQQNLHPKVSSQLLILLVKSLLGILFLFVLFWLGLVSGFCLLVGFTLLCTI